jgi:DNA-binding transcriptional ArsR family regulator
VPWRSNSGSLAKFTEIRRASSRVSSLAAARWHEDWSLPRTRELARPFNIALPSFTQHLDVLERCGLVCSRKVGRVRTYRLVPQPLRAAERWITQQRAVWERRLDQLDDYLLKLKEDMR